MREILVAVVPRTDVEQLMRNRKEASKTIFGQIVFGRVITTNPLGIRKLIGTLRSLRNLLGCHHISLISKKPADLEFILSGWKKISLSDDYQDFFLCVNLRPVFFCVFIAKLQFQKAADVEE